MEVDSIIMISLLIIKHSPPIFLLFPSADFLVVSFRRIFDFLPTHVGISLENRVHMSRIPRKIQSFQLGGFFLLKKNIISVR